MGKTYKVKNAGGKRIEVDIPGSKSISNRALILAAQAKGETLLKNMLFSDDTRYMIKALEQLGNTLEVDEDKKTVKVIPNEDKKWDKCELFVGNAGTAMRFLPTYIATGEGEVVLTGIERMKERPIRDLVDALRALEVDVEYMEKEGFPPIKVNAKGLNGGKVKIKGDKSSQYITSILLSAPSSKKGITIEIEGDLVSIPYVEITRRMMKDFGMDFVNKDNKVLEVEAGEYKGREYIVEGDCSSASYFFAMGALGNRVKLNNIKLDSIQGDIKFLDVLIDTGLKVVDSGDNFVEVEGDGNVRGIDVDMKHISDTAQTLSVVALFADKTTTIRNVYNMRIKETDRIRACYNELTKLGAKVTEFEDGLTIEPLQKVEDYNSGVLIDTYDDHRMAMSFALAGLKIKDVIINDPDCVSKTFPNYFDEFEKVYK
jgi:3-phosphoshikimate 1-carboxyvinyltransferase